MSESRRITKLWGVLRETVPVPKIVEKHHEDVTRFWSFSEYALRVCERYPQDAVWVLAVAIDRHETGNFPENLDALQSVSSFRQAQSMLRKFRHLRFLRICWQDLMQSGPINQLLATQSQVAEQVVCAAESWQRAFMKKEHGYATRSGSKQDEPLIVLALGKLGGRDLNFSSDIDLIFCHADELQYVGKHSWSVHEYYLEMGRQFIALTGESTADGFGFRVDLRLRPFGDSGPLVVSIDQLEHYLQAHGREWERYAFVKARVINGTPEQQAEIHKLIRPFVYRRYIDFSVIDALRSMKSMIERQVQRKQLKDDIKLGRGGIREIEFIVQVIQLIRGGQDQSLQVTGLLDALTVIENKKYLQQEDVAVLRTAYDFLRRLENHLQMRAEHQVHALPSDDTERELLAHTMQMDSVAQLLKQINDVRDQVHAIFSWLIEGQKEDASTDRNELSAFGSLEDLLANKAEYAAQLQNAHALELIEKLGTLCSSASYRQQDTIGRKRFKQFVACLLPVLDRDPQPVQTLQRLLPLIRSILRRSSYLVLLVENRVALDTLVLLVSKSPWIAQHFAAYPILLDDLLGAQDGQAFLHRDELSDLMRNEIGLLDNTDYEHVLEKIRLFKHAQLLRIARASVTGQLTLMKASDQLSWLAECIISGCLEYLQDQFPAVQESFGIVAFGKLGGIEMSYASDLDLVFVYLPVAGESAPDLTRHIRMAQKLTQMLSLRTVSGKLYEVDVRLRPHGSSGPIVSSLEYMQSYYKSNAWTWEHQALVRARMIAGNPKMQEAFTLLRREILCQPRDPEELRHQIVDMRSKMRDGQKASPAGYFDLKKDRGGITDIEFMVQYEVLVNAHEYPSVAEFTDNFRQLQSFKALKRMADQSIERLTEIYLAYRSRNHELALQALDTLVPASEFEAERGFVSQCWDEIMKDGK